MASEARPQSSNGRTAKVVGYRVAVKWILTALLELADTGEISEHTRFRLEDAARGL